VPKNEEGVSESGRREKPRKKRFWEQIVKKLEEEHDRMITLELWGSRARARISVLYFKVEEKD